MHTMRSLRLLAVAILLVGIASFAFVITAMLDAVELISVESGVRERVVDNIRESSKEREPGDSPTIRRSPPKSRLSHRKLQSPSSPTTSGHVAPPASTPEVKVKGRALNSGVDDESDYHQPISVDRVLDNELLQQLPASHSPSIWPRPGEKYNDRILAQLKYIPRSYNRSNVKVIYLPAGLGELPPGRLRFRLDQCPVDACSLTASSHYEHTAAVRLFQGDAFFYQPVIKPPGQIWVLWLLESPSNTPQFANAEKVINWTATYRTDSTIVTPYEKYVDYDTVLSRRTQAVKTYSGHRNNAATVSEHSAMSSSKVQAMQQQQQEIRWQRSVSAARRRNYAAGKTGLVAWFVSNCVANNRRYEFVQELRQHIPVDVYGECGQLVCSRSHQFACDRLIRQRYKFYLAFENSNCDEYITEKFFRNALWNEVVPIAMGARKSDYEAVAPPHSFIYVEDFRSALDLARYLLHLNASDSQYNEYMAWKHNGDVDDDLGGSSAQRKSTARKESGRFIDTRFWCRLCAMIHDDSGHVTWYDDIERWWHSPGVCTADRWDSQQQPLSYDGADNQLPVS